MDAATRHMKSTNESRKEVPTLMESLVKPKKMLRIAAWNVRTMYEPGKTAQVANEMNRYRVNIMGISEMRWTGSGILTLSSGQMVCYSGRADGQHQEGVGIMMDREASKSLLEWEPVNSRIIRARFFSKYVKTTVIQCYAPTEAATDEEKDHFYNILQEQLEKTPKHDLLLLVGDFNAKIGSDNIGCESCMGKEAVGDRNENGQRLTDLCLENSLVIGGSIFQHKTIHKLTWTSPDGRTSNQIDHILINQKWRRSMIDVKAVRGADVGSDHHLVLCKLLLKLKNTHRKSCTPLFDSSRLKDEMVRQEFVAQLNNRFQNLRYEPSDNVNLLYQHIQETFNIASRNVLGYTRKEKKEWISEGTWQLIERRRAAKQDALAGNTLGRATALSTYSELCKLVKSRLRKDKREYIDALAAEAETAAEKGDTRTVYKVTRRLTGGFANKTTVVKDKHGKVLTKQADQLKRWAEHFSETLNRPDPEVEANIVDMGIRVDLNLEHISQQEIEQAIRQMKSNRAPGNDKITADMLQANPTLSAQSLVHLFNKVWDEEKVPEAWKQGVLVKLPKKGDLSVCTNWRGINLLSVPGKIFCRVILQRLKHSLESVLREEQAGFRTGRGCADQIFVLRTIVEQSLEWNSSLYINYIDFEKAFDSIHHPSLWRILRSYGLPEKVVNILKDMYANNRCCVRHNGKESDWFRVKTGVRQGCVISPTLFLIVIDWVMRRATNDQPRGLVWGTTSRIEDCDFADDIALLSHTQADVQTKTNNVDQVARTVGLRIHPDKSKIMIIRGDDRQRTLVQGTELEEVMHFKYLGSYISADGKIENEITARIGLAAQAFKQLRAIWKSSVLSMSTKVKIYKSNVRSVLLYASETWRSNKRIESRLRGFEGRCLRRILRLRWEQRVPNSEVSERTGIRSIVEEVKRRRWKWLGHVLRMAGNRHPLIALRWIPPGRRQRGRPRGTWRRTVESEMRLSGKNWDELTRLAQNRGIWRKFVDALCSSRGEED